MKNKNSIQNVFYLRKGEIILRREIFFQLKRERIILAQKEVRKLFSLEAMFFSWGASLLVGSVDSACATAKGESNRSEELVFSHLELVLEAAAASFAVYLKGQFNFFIFWFLGLIFLNLRVAGFEAGIGKVDRRGVTGAVLGDDVVAATKHFCLMNENVTSGGGYIPGLWFLVKNRNIPGKFSGADVLPRNAKSFLKNVQLRSAVNWNITIWK